MKHKPIFIIKGHGISETGFKTSDHAFEAIEAVYCWRAQSIIVVRFPLTWRPLDESTHVFKGPTPVSWICCTGIAVFPVPFPVPFAPHYIENAAKTCHLLRCMLFCLRFHADSNPIAPTIFILFVLK
jgi:hypothetical protein